MEVGQVVQPSLDGTIETWPSAPEGGWKRVLLKLSGEAFAGGGGLGVGGAPWALLVTCTASFGLRTVT